MSERRSEIFTVTDSIGIAGSAIENSNEQLIFKESEMKRLADRMATIKPSATLAISAKAKELKAQGIDLIEFGAGEPDFAPPQFICDAAAAAAREGRSKYTDVAGLPELRDLLIERNKKSDGLEYTRAETIITNGGKGALFNLFQAILSVGDEALVPSPYWVSYPEMIALAGAKPVIVNSREENDFAIDIDLLRSKITPRSKAIIVNSPSNPTGAVYSDETMRAIVDLAKEKDLFIISDEIYKDVNYQDQPIKSLGAIAPEFRENIIIVSGLSKNFSMTGWRVGWAIGPADVIKAVNSIQGQSTSNVSSLAQYAAIAALKEGPIHIRKWLEAFKERRDIALATIDQIDGIRARVPMGAFYLFPNISGLFGRKWGSTTLNDSYDVTKFLLEEARVALVPGAPFGADDHIRISYALETEALREGMNRIKRAVEILR